MCTNNFYVKAALVSKSDSLALTFFTGKAHEASFNRSGMKISGINSTIFIANWS
jgi:hypothetical protein